MMRLAAFVFACLSGTANAFTGNQLHELMNASDVSAKTTVIAYIRGYLDASWMSRGTFRVHDGKQVSGTFFCMPEGATVDQAVDIVKAELAASPQHRHLPASAFVYASLSRAWPCR
jgi:hypothetical protein